MCEHVYSFFILIVMHASQICIYEIYNKVIKERIGRVKEKIVVRTDRKTNM